MEGEQQEGMENVEEIKTGEGVRENQVQEREREYSLTIARVTEGGGD